MMRYRVRFGAGLAMLLFTVGCGASSAGGSTGSATTPPAAAAAAATVNIVPDPATIGAFTPPAVTVKTGDTVEWDFQDLNPHTTSSDMGVWSSLPLTKGKRYSYKFTKPGTYAYHCSIHPEMKGTITVS